MSNRRTAQKRAVNELERNPMRSPLYYWLLARYETLAPTLTKSRPNWRALRDRAMRANINDKNGQAPSARITRETWRKVEAEVAAQRAFQLTGLRPGRQKPPYMPRDWQPPVARSPPDPSPELARAAASTPSSTASSTPAIAEKRGGDAFAHVWDEIDRKSGR